MFPTLEQIKEDAKVAGTYFTSLLLNGVNTTDAITLTGNYMNMLLITRANAAQAQRPEWDRG